MNKRFAISEYHNVAEIYAKINALVSQPLRLVKRDKMVLYLNHFELKCARSKEMTNEAKKYIPGGVQHNLAFNYPFPLVFTKAEGAYLYDLDGNKYIDFFAGRRPNSFGKQLQVN